MEAFTQTPASAQSLLVLYPRLGIPHFQRGLVWNEDATGLLLESLYFGTPCGNIILWQPLQPGVHGQPMEGQTECELLLVDGQQRTRMLHEACNDVGDPEGKVWCLDLTIEPRCSPLLPDTARRNLFVYVQHPAKTKNPRYRHNLVPLSELVSDPIPTLRARYVDKSKPELPDEEIDTALAVAAKTVREMWDRTLFNVIRLKERVDGTDGQRFGIDYIVSLYNRINSAGRRVEPQEIAYATLVKLYPDTTARLKGLAKPSRPSTSRP